MPATYSTVRKLKSEAEAELDRDKDDFKDLIQMQLNYNEYIKEKCIPFKVKLRVWSNSVVCACTGVIPLSFTLMRLEV